MSSPYPVYLREELQALREARRAARRKRQVITIAAVTVGLLATSAAALVATDTLRIGGGTPSALADRPGPTFPATTIATVAPAAVCRSPLTSDDPLRLWIGGDSLAGSLGPALGEAAADTGVVEPTF